MSSELGEPIASGGVSELHHWSTGRVLKRFAEGFPRDVAEVEVRATQLAHRGGLRVPGDAELIEIDGRIGIAMELIDARPVVDSILAAPNPHEAAVMGRLAAEVQTSVHALRADGLPKAVDGYPALIDTCTELSTAARRALLGRLAELPEATRLCHGDFHAGNLLDARDGLAVIDWGAAHAGRPAADVAQTLVAMGEWLEMGLGEQIDAAVAAFLDGFLAHHFDAGSVDEGEVQAWRPIVAAVRLAVPHPPTSTDLLRREASSLDSS